MPNLIDITGKTFGRLTVICMAPTDGMSAVHWRCKCACGKEKIVCGASLRSGATASCGCFLAEATGARTRKHGHHGHPIYYVWRGMIKRCGSPKNPSYKYYGGRGFRRIAAQYQVSP